MLFLTIKYWWILRISLSTEKSYTVLFKEISLCSSFVESFGVFYKQTFYK